MLAIRCQPRTRELDCGSSLSVCIPACHGVQLGWEVKHACLEPAESDVGGGAKRWRWPAVGSGALGWGGSQLSKRRLSGACGRRAARRRRRRRRVRWQRAQLWQLAERQRHQLRHRRGGHGLCGHGGAADGRGGGPGGPGHGEKPAGHHAGERGEAEGVQGMAFALLFKYFMRHMQWRR